MISYLPQMGRVQGHQISLNSAIFWQINESTGTLWVVHNVAAEICLHENQKAYMAVFSKLKDFLTL